MWNMEKLIFTFWDGSDYSDSGRTVLIPFEYESKEKAENDFFELAYSTLKQYLTKDENYWKGIEFFQNHASFDTMQFFHPNPDKEKLLKYENIDLWEYNAPSILTLDEWFLMNKQEIYQKVFDNEK